MMLLQEKNIDEEIQHREQKIKEVGISPAISGLTGLPLLKTIKREKVGVGPYPDVSLFEAANRIMSDMVILHGVKWLLKEKVFPFDAYLVQLGHDNKSTFDVEAENGRETLAGEAFNVAGSFFQTKKSAMLGKLRDKAGDKTFRIILVNDDAVEEGYRPELREGEHCVFVNVGSSTCQVVSGTPLQRGR